MTPDPNIERLDEDWTPVYEHVPPHPMCCDECKQARADLEAARADLSKSKALLRDAISQVIQMKRDLEAARAALRQQDDVIRAMTFVLDDLLDRASDVNQPQRTHGNQPGAFALYAEQRLRELVAKVAALAAPDPEGDDRKCPSLHPDYPANRCERPVGHGGDHHVTTLRTGGMQYGPVKWADPEGGAG